MKFSLKQAIAGSLLAVMAAAPAFAFDPANVGSGNGSLILVAFDADAGKSVAVDLGLNYLDFLNSSTSRDGRAATDVTPDAGLTLNFNIDMSVFGGNLSNVAWNVFAADQGGNASTTQALVTAPLGMTTLTGITNGNVASVIGTSGYNNIYAQCGAVTVCTGTDALSNTFFGGSSWGYNMQYLQNYMSASLGSALGFYSLDRSSATGTGTPVTTAYANSDGVQAQWSLSAGGLLTYTSAAVGSTVTPVPAAIWLLVSGLGGLGVIGRRRQVA